MSDYIYAIEFNLGARGDAAEEILADAARTWPKVWGEIPGVTSTVLLSSALALGGEFDYQLRVGLESLATLARVDEAIKSGANGWRKASASWFRHRTAARAHVSQYVDGDRGYSQAGEGRAGAIHIAFQAADSGKALDTASLESVSGVVSTQGLRPVLGGAGAEQRWVRLESLESLDRVSELLGAGTAAVFGELREVDGALFAGA
ncbi:hypothetical protein V5P93_003058 [Actinokineospora auranticolor]|uniref:Uncharacterized protein n=1 Tax=Actinokineospora auranticolor TaxID=155976 RepID=A0A2S6H157_9PSEU|nr:hypothetical protein [Actinokineospora auranticolor]PPK71194.1 hypothetical protein CLV40_101383 [Actinokineospora auranticolor]